MTTMLEAGPEVPMGPREFIVRLIAAEGQAYQRHEVHFRLAERMWRCPKGGMVQAVDHPWDFDLSKVWRDLAL